MGWSCETPFSVSVNMLHNLLFFYMTRKKAAVTKNEICQQDSLDLNCKNKTTEKVLVANCPKGILFVGLF